MQKRGPYPDLPVHQIPKNQKTFNPAEPDIHDIGILASNDPVALDQACIDLVYAQKGGDGASLVSRIESCNGQHIDLQSG